MPFSSKVIASQLDLPENKEWTDNDNLVKDNDNLVKDFQDQTWMTRPQQLKRIKEQNKRSLDYESSCTLCISLSTLRIALTYIAVESRPCFHIKSGNIILRL